jgi:DNA-binding response OmpR family regulator
MMNSAISGDNRFSSNCSAEAHAVAFSGWLCSKMHDAVLQRAEAKRRRFANGDRLVMIVDDEEVVAITLAEILRRRGVNAVWFSEPLVALEYAKDGAIDLLISDFTMPLMDGILLATQIQEAVPTCGLFLFSAVCDQPQFKARMKALGPDARVEAKPMQVAQLLATVTSLLSRESTIQLETAALNLSVS